MRHVARRYWQPRLLGAEAGIGVGIPLHGRALAVAAVVARPVAAPDWIFPLRLGLGIVVLHADFFAVIHDGRAAQCEHERRHQLGDLVVVLTVGVAGVMTHAVMI